MTETIDRARLNGAVTVLAFGGRRRRVYNRIVELSGARPGDHVLDVGSSAGYLARRLAAAVGPDGRVTGVDPSTGAIGQAQRRARGNLEFRVGVAQDLPFPDASFDVVTCTLAVHHIPEPERAAAFAEMYRVLRPGGQLLVADFRPGEGRHSLHRVGQGRRHGDGVPLEELVTAAEFRVETRGDLPLLRYVRAFRPEAA